MERVKDKGGAQRGAANRIPRREQARWARERMGQRQLMVPWARGRGRGRDWGYLGGSPEEAGAEKGSGEGVTEASQPWLERKETPKGKRWRGEE